MKDFNLTPELLKKAEGAATAEELVKIAEENGITISEEDACKYFAQLHKSGELSDDEIDNVAGGGCDEEEENKEDPASRCGDWSGMESVFGEPEYQGCSNCNYYKTKCLKGHEVYHS